MKILLGSIAIVAMTLFLFSFSQAHAECGNMTGDCDNEGNMKSDSNYKHHDDDNDDTKSNDNNNNDDSDNGSCTIDDCYTNGIPGYPSGTNDDDNNDKSSDNHNKKSKNDPCNYDGLNVCDKNGDCDEDHYDCVSYDKDGNECTTGQCPGDDDKVCWKNQEFIGCSDKDNNSDKDSHHKHGNDNDNHKSNNNNDNSKSSSSSSSDSVKKFKIKVILDNVTIAESDTFRMRVIVYGPHTLNKPTLDKPAQLVNVQGCGYSCTTDWGFTAWKVPVGSEIQACVWNSETGHQNCGYGKSDSQDGPEIIHVSLPSVSAS